MSSSFTAINHAAHIAGPPTENPLLFKNIAFWLSARVPMRALFVKQIQDHGGVTCAIEKSADIMIADHARKDAPAGSYSYKWIEQSISGNTLVEKEPYLCAPAEKPTCSVGSTQPRTASRNPFTAEDDLLLYQWVEGLKREGKAVKGNLIYQELELKHRRHPWQSWRDRYLKYLVNKPPKLLAPKSPSQRPRPAATHSRGGARLDSIEKSSEQTVDAPAVDKAINQPSKEPEFPPQGDVTSTQVVNSKPDDVSVPKASDQALKPIKHQASRASSNNEPNDQAPNSKRDLSHRLNDASRSLKPSPQKDQSSISKDSGVSEMSIPTTDTSRRDRVRSSSQSILADKASATVFDHHEGSGFEIAPNSDSQISKLSRRGELEPGSSSSTVDKTSTRVVSQPDGLGHNDAKNLGNQTVDASTSQEMQSASPSIISNDTAARVTSRPIAPIPSFQTPMLPITKNHKTSSRLSFSGRSSPFGYRQGQRLSLDSVSTPVVYESPFTEEDRSFLFGAAQAIQNLAVGVYDTAWEDFAQENPEHSAFEWRHFYENVVLPDYKSIQSIPSKRSSLRSRRASERMSLRSVDSPSRLVDGHMAQLSDDFVTTASPTISRNLPIPTSAGDPTESQNGTLRVAEAMPINRALRPSEVRASPNVRRILTYSGSGSGSERSSDIGDSGMIQRKRTRPLSDDLSDGNGAIQDERAKRQLLDSTTAHDPSYSASQNQAQPSVHLRDDGVVENGNFVLHTNQLEQEDNVGEGIPFGIHESSTLPEEEKENLIRNKSGSLTFTSPHKHHRTDQVLEAFTNPPKDFKLIAQVGDERAISLDQSQQESDSAELVDDSFHSVESQQQQKSAEVNSAVEEYSAGIDTHETPPENRNESHGRQRLAEESTKPNVDNDNALQEAMPVASSRHPSTPRARGKNRYYNEEVQDILDAQTPVPDLDVPPPPPETDSDQSVDVRSPSKRRKDKSRPRSRESVSLFVHSETHPLQRSHPNRGRKQASPPKYDGDSTITQTREARDAQLAKIENFITVQAKAGWEPKDVIYSLQRTSLDFILATQVLNSLAKGYGFPEAAGIWSGEDDQLLLNGTREDFELLRLRHTREGLRKRREYLGDLFRLDKSKKGYSSLIFQSDVSEPSSGSISPSL